MGRSQTVFFFSLFLLCALFVPNLLYAQIDDAELDAMRKQAQQSTNQPYEITGVNEQNGKMIVSYTLKGKAEDEFEISLIFLRERDAKFKVIPKTITGNIGVGNFAGNDNKIIWDYKKDYAQELKGDDFYFILNVKKIEPTEIPWTWIGIGGAVAAAGGAAVFFLSGNDEKKTSTEVPALTVSRPN